MQPVRAVAEGELVRVSLRTESVLLTPAQVEALHTELERALAPIVLARRAAHLVARGE